MSVQTDNNGVMVNQNRKQNEDTEQHLLPHALLSHTRHYQKTNQLPKATFGCPNPGLNNLTEGCAPQVKGLRSHLAHSGFVLEKNPPNNRSGCGSDRGIMPSSSLIKGFPHGQMFADLYCFLLLLVWRQKLLCAEVAPIGLVVPGNCTPALLSYRGIQWRVAVCFDNSYYFPQ